MNDYKELIAHIQGDAAFRHIISECGEDGRVWFDKRFICDYVSHLKYAIEQLVEDIESYKCAFADLHNEISNYCETIDTLEKERDAAVADFTSVIADECGLNQCRYCKYQEDDYQCHHYCIPYSENWGWEWRGVQEDNT